MRSLYTGNILLMICCAFYLAWWMIAFKPSGAIKGMASGWLLIPAAAAGIAAILAIVRGISGNDSGVALIPTLRIVLTGVIAYVVLLVVTNLLLKRPVTTELLLIVGWAVLAVAEVSALYGYRVFAAGQAWIFAAVVILMAVISMICYLFYYKLDEVAGYYDGIAPLAIVAAVMLAITIAMRISAR